MCQHAVISNNVREAWDFIHIVGDSVLSFSSFFFLKIPPPQNIKRKELKGRDLGKEMKKSWPDDSHSLRSRMNGPQSGSRRPGQGFNLILGGSPIKT
jgi:hypothetical protein